MPYLLTEDDVEIYYRDWGAGSPIVLIHGWPLTGDSWESQAEFLAENGHRVIAYDRRGFGRSDQPWTGYDYDTLAADLHALMEELDLQDATLVGFSMGGGEVVRYLSTYGESRVAKAVLISAVTPYLLKTEDNPSGVDQKVFAEIERQIRAGRQDFLKDFAAKFYGRTTLKHPVSETVLQWFQSMAWTGSLRATLGAAKAWSTTDFRADMEQIRLPVLVIHGTGDATIPIDASGRRSVELLQNGTLLEYEDEPHGLTVTATERVNEDLLDFIGTGARQKTFTDPQFA
ncbi:alpha/beta fold hydrolase [Silvibacterium acidisoli]|uniref:alpha/beta fold hydrolase n=1 Tax=Acidobacteriaceae bacterium ZG23-2 TaxID=2883246 RepID=UPI00406CB45D